MTTTDLQPFLGALLQVAEVLNASLTAPKQAGYWLALQDLPLAAFQAACLAVMKHEQFFPAPVIFREYAREHLHRQRFLAPATRQELLALREELVPQDEIQALIASIWKDQTLRAS
jgi:hypothetical protein